MRRTTGRRQQRLNADRGGAVAILAAIMLSALLFFAGLTIDIGAALFKKRELQGATDLAAMAAAQNIGNASAIASAILAANGFAGAQVVNLSTGNYDTSKPTGQRFVAGQAPLDAVQMSTAYSVPLSFVRAIVRDATLTVPAAAAAAQIGEAGLEAGSGLAALTSSGLPNAILGQMLGSNISLSLASYTGLANTQINALNFLNALAAQLNVTAGTYGSLLNGTASIGTILQAEVTALSQSGSIGQVQAATTGLATLIPQISGSPSVKLGTLFNAGIWQNATIGTIDPNTALQTEVNVFQLITFAAQIANGSNLVSANSVISVPTTTPLATVNVATTAIEPAQGSYYGLGPAGLTVHTSQIRLQLTFNLTTKLVIPLVASLSVTLPIYVEVGYGTASLSAVSCSTAPATDALVDVSATPGVASGYVGTVTSNAMSNFSQAVSVSPAAIVNAAGILTVTGSANASVQGSAQALVFTQAEINAQTSQRVSSTGMTSNFLANLQNTLVLQVSPLPSTTVLPLLTPLLTPVFALTDGVADQVLSTLGVQVGYLDVTVTGDRCGVPGLVQ